MHLPESVQLSGSRWDAAELYFYVREPFPGKAKSVEIIFGRISQEQPMSLFSGMAEKGILFSEGMEDDCVVFGAGMEVKIGVAAQQGRLVV